MEFVELSVQDIEEWEVNKNLRAITEDNYFRLKEALQNKHQFKPLLITPDDSNPGKFITLAGNHRIRAYKELRVDKVFVSVIVFKQNEVGLWYAIRDGIEEPQRYNTKEDAMMDWALTDNEENAYYDREEFVNIMDNFGLNWDERLVNFSNPLTVPASLHSFGIDPNAETEGNEDSKSTMYQVVVDCQSDIEQNEYFDKLQALGIPSKKVTR